MKENQNTKPLMQKKISPDQTVSDTDTSDSSKFIASGMNVPQFDAGTEQFTAYTGSPAPLDEPIDRHPADEADDHLEEVPADAPEDLPLPMPASKPRNILQHLKRKKQEQAEQRMSDTERIRKKSGLSEDDVALALELGYEDELGRLVGYEGLKTLKKEHKQRYEAPGYKHYRTAFGYSGKETLNDETSPAIIAKYLHDRNFLIIRTVLTSIAALILLFLDYPQLLGGAADAFIETYPYVFPLSSLCILLSVSALSFRQINAGLRSFLKATPTPYSVPATMLVLVLIYDIITLFLQEEVLRVNMLTCSLLVVLALCDIHRLLGEMRAFRILSAEGEKTVLEPTLPRKKMLRRDKKIIKVINDDADEFFYRVRYASQITGFFRRFNTTESAHLPFQTLIGISIALSVVIAFVAAVISPSLSYALSTFITVMYATAPATAMFSFFHPLQRANKILADCKCVLVGNEAVGEFSDSKTLIFDDTDLYTTEKRAELTVKDGDDLRHDLKLAGAVFRKLGGTLDCLAKTVGVSGEDPSVAFIYFADNGVEAWVDNAHRVILGSTEYMKKHDVRLPKETADQSLRRTKNTAVIHFSVDGVLKFTYEIEYVAKLSFEALIEDLATTDTAVAIQSYDPALNDPFLLSCREDRQIRVRAIKPGRYEGNPLLDEADSGAVAIGHTYNVIYPLYAAKAVKRSKKFGMRLQILASAIGVVTAGVFACFPAINILTPLSVTLYHGAFVIISWLFTHLTINPRTLHIHRFF